MSKYMTSIWCSECDDCFHGVEVKFWNTLEEAKKKCEIVDDVPSWHATVQEKKGDDWIVIEDDE